MKRKLINSFIILSGSTMITKIFSVFNRMMLSRLLNEQGMALYILIIPTLSLCITLAQFSIPSAVFRLISNPKYNNKKVIISAILICLTTCLIITTGIFVFSKIIAVEFLKQEQAYLPLLSLIPFVPLVGISGIIKNYYLGKEDVWDLSIAQLLEEVSRLLFTYIFIRMFIHLPMNILVSIAILSMSVGELTSILYLYYKLHRHIPIYIRPVSYFQDHFIFKDMMNIALPLTGSRLLHSCYNFIEPIILVYILSKMNIDNSQIHLQYAIISGYVISLLITPTFFNNVILRLLLPILNKDIAYNQKYALQKHVLYGVIACFFISLPFTLLFYFFGDYCLQFMYNTTNGYEYLKYMSIPFTLFYLQTPLTATLQALNKNKEMFWMSTLECLIEFILLIILTPYYHVLSVAIVMLIGLLTTLILSAYHVYKYVYSQDIY
ncbi:MAG: oligosaccharide flippase family protein [Erysipelotrichales bacterium]|nr:oligosaccharide flippase family protein [Erysipelotrichales bacterium]